MRNIVFGDTGGWMPQLLAAFDELGINAEESTIPENMRIIHCGDLVHKGPFSSHLLAIVTGLMVRNPGRWVQLMGNHEAQHLPGAPMFWACDCTPADAGLLNVWHEDGFMRPTFGLTDEASTFTAPGSAGLTVDRVSMLFSHGGLTEGFWDWAVGAPEDAVVTAARLNALPLDIITTPGMMLGENRPLSRIGPVWAVGNTEVFQSWQARAETAMPFTQVHGHTTSYSYDRNRWWPGLEDFRARTVLDPASRAVVTELNNNLMLGIDPGFSVQEPRLRAQPWFEFETSS